MIKIRALLAAFIMTCVLLLGSTAVAAEEIRQPVLETGDTTVRKGQKIEFVFSLDNYGERKTGINTLKGTVEYDPDIFEQPAQENFEPLESWESVYYNRENGQFS